MSELKIIKRLIPEEYYPQLCVYEDDVLKLQLSYKEIGQARMSGRNVGREFDKMIDTVLERFPDHHDYINKTFGINE